MELRKRERKAISRVIERERGEKERALSDKKVWNRAMGRYIRKCKGTGAVGEMTVMEVTQVVGVRTRSRAMKAAAMAKANYKEQAEAELEAYLELRSRRLFISPRITRPAVNSGSRRCNISKLEASSSMLSRCSSTSSLADAKLEKDTSERCHLRSGDAEVSTVYN